MISQSIEFQDGETTVLECFGDPAPDKASTPVVVFFPALGVSIKYYRELANQWAAKGLRVVLAETRGQGQSSVKNVKRSNFGYKEILTIDIPAILKNVRTMYGAAPLYLAGHSLGGQFALLYASRYHPKLAGIVLVAAGSNFHSTLSKSSSALIRHFNIGLTRVINRGLGYFPGDKLGFGGRQPKNMIEDWSFEGLNGHYRICGDSFDYNAALRSLKVNLLMLSLEGDPLVPRSSADYLARKLESASVDQSTIPASAFGRAAASHFGWAKKPEPVLERVETWMSNRGGPRSASQHTAT